MSRFVVTQVPVCGVLHSSKRPVDERLRFLVIGPAQNCGSAILFCFHRVCDVFSCKTIRERTLACLAVQLAEDSRASGFWRFMRWPAATLDFENCGNLGMSRMKQPGEGGLSLIPRLRRNTQKHIHIKLDDSHKATKTTFSVAEPYWCTIPSILIWASPR